MLTCNGFLFIRLSCLRCESLDGEARQLAGRLVSRVAGRRQRGPTTARRGIGRAALGVQGDASGDAAGHHTKVRVRQRLEEVMAGRERDRVWSRVEQATEALGQITVRRRRQTIELHPVSHRQLDDARLADLNADLQWL